MINGPAAACSSKARERLQVLLRIRPCPSARRITAESQSQRGQASLHIESYSSSDEWIRHDKILPFFASKLRETWLLHTGARDISQPGASPLRIASNGL